MTTRRNFKGRQVRIRMAQYRERQALLDLSDFCDEQLLRIQGFLNSTYAQWSQRGRNRRTIAGWRMGYRAIRQETTIERRGGIVAEQEE